MKIVRQNTFGSSSWSQLGGLLIAIGQFDKAGYDEALDYYKKGLAIEEKNPIAPNHQSLAISHNNIGGVYYHKKEYSKAFMFYEKVLKIEQKTLLPNDPSLATTYGNIGGVYFKMKEYVKALSFYEKDIQICEKALPSDHYLLSISCNNIRKCVCRYGRVHKSTIISRTCS